MRRRRLVGGALLLSALGCGSAEEQAPPPPAPSPAPALAPAAEPPAPAAQAALALPAARDVAKGQATYQQLCASCHGPRGAGDGPAGQALDPRPARHDDGAYMNALSNEHLFRVIEQGGAALGKSPLMAPWGGALSDAQIWDVVAFVRTLAQPPYPGPRP